MGVAVKIGIEVMYFVFKLQVSVLIAWAWHMV